MRFLLEEQLPVSKEIIHQTAGWLKDSGVDDQVD